MITDERDQMSKSLNAPRRRNTLLEAVALELPPRMASALRRLVAAGAMKGVPGGLAGNRLSLSLYEAQSLERAGLARITRADGTPWAQAIAAPTLAGFMWVKSRDDQHPTAPCHWQDQDQDGQQQSETLQ